MRLWVRLTLSFLFLISLVLASVGALLFYVEKRHFKEEQIIRQNDSVEKLAQVCVESSAEHNDLILLNYILSLKRNPEIRQASFIDPEGRVIVHSDMQEVGRTLSNDLLSRLGSASGLIREESQNKSIDVFLPVFNAGHRIGVARIVYDTAYFEAQVDRTLRSSMLRFSYVIGIAAVLGLLLSLVLARGVTNPIRHLVDATQAIGKGDLAHRVQWNSRDEIGQLASSFNDMSRKLQELDELKNDFVSSVSHELRSPLTAIKGFLQMFQLGISGPLNAQQKENVDVMLQCTDRLGRFVNNILDVAKFDAGMVEFNLESINPRDVAQEMVKLFQAQAQSEKINLVLSAPGAISLVKFDGDRLRQVFTNLINNAMKFTPEGGTVTVWVKDEPEQVLAGVTDTGAGIPSEDLPKLFNRFEQVKKTKNIAKSKGTGLGLTIVKKIVEGMGGKIGVKSDLGKGTTFFFSMKKSGRAAA